MKWLVLGATGILGEHAMHVLEARGHEVIGAARSGTDRSVDIADLDALQTLLQDVSPDAIFNCAALASIPACEEDPGTAYRVNTRPVSIMADWSRETDRPLIHVSTDHFFVEGGRTLHPETERPVLVNEYARTKLASETFALTAPKAIVLRTNLATARKGFGKWVIDSLQTRAPMTLFTDVFCSTIPASTFAEAAVDLVGQGANGLINLAAGDVFSKAEFIEAFADELGIELDWVTYGSVASLSVPRATSMGLDVSKAESALGYTLPTLKQVARTVISELHE